MNWTSEAPIEGVKCIVETEKGNTFPAQFVCGEWRGTEKSYIVERVKRWIIYPEDEGPNDFIDAEVLLKYAVRDYRKMKEIAKNESGKVKELRKLNKELTEEFNRIYKELMELRASCAESVRGKETEVNNLRTENRNLTLEIEELRQRDEASGSVSLKELQRENKRLKGYLKSFTQICEMANEMEMAV